MPTYKLTIEYEGTRYSGWQAQGNTPKTVQGHLIRAATQVLGEVDVGGAGRTDAGVHAAAQVAHLRAHKAVDPLQLTRKLNDLLPHDINVLAAARASDRFHARRAPLGSLSRGGHVRRRVRSPARPHRPRAMSEADLIARIRELFPRTGDDAAVVGAQVITTDVLVEDVDFIADTPLHFVARKSIAVNLSDL